MYKQPLLPGIFYRLPARNDRFIAGRSQDPPPSYSTSRTSHYQGSMAGFSPQVTNLGFA